MATMPCWAITLGAPLGGPTIGPIAPHGVAGWGLRVGVADRQQRQRLGDGGGRAQGERRTLRHMTASSRKSSWRSSFRLEAVSAFAHCPCLLPRMLQWSSRPSTPLQREAASSCRGRERHAGSLCHLEESTPSCGSASNAKIESCSWTDLGSAECRRASIRLRPRRRSAWAAACGASWSRLCPTPPVMSRCSYLPENLLRSAAGSGWGAPLASPSIVIVGTVMMGPWARFLFQIVVFQALAVGEGRAASGNLWITMATWSGLSKAAELRSNVASSKSHLGEACRQMSFEKSRRFLS